MKKVYLFYIVTTSCLFSALFAAFALAGLGSVPPPPPAASEEPAKPRTNTRIDYPDLQPGTQYTVSHPTVISGDPEGLFNRHEKLLPGGVFQIEGRDEIVEEFWYRITVNNGFEDYTMYLKAENLNWQDVKPVRKAGPRIIFPGRNMRARMRERIANGIDAAPPPEPDPEPTTQKRALASLRGAVEAVSTQGLLTAALAAILITMATASTISVLVWLYRTRRWYKSSLFDELPSERGEEFYEDNADDAHADEPQETGYGP